MMNRCILRCSLLTSLVLAGCPKSGEKSERPDDEKSQATHREVQNSNDSGAASTSGGSNSNEHDDNQKGATIPAAHQEALSVLTADDFFVVKLNVEKARGNPLTKHLPEDFNHLLAHSVPMPLPVDVDEQAAELHTLLIALSPGPGRLEDVIFGVSVREDVSNATRQADGEDDQPCGFQDVLIPTAEEARILAVFDLEPESEEGQKKLRRLRERRAKLDAARDRLNRLVEEAERRDVSNGKVNQELPPPPVYPTIYAKFNSREPVQAWRNVLADMVHSKAAARIEHGKSEYFRVEAIEADGRTGWVYLGERHIVASSIEDAVKSAIDNAGKPGDAPLVQRMARMNLDADIVAAALFEPVRPALRQALAQGGDALPKQIPLAAEKLDAVALAIDLEGEQLVEIDAQGSDEEGAEVVRDIVKGVVSGAKLMIGQRLVAARKEGAAAETLEFLQFAHQTLGSINVQSEDVRLQVSLARPEDFSEAIGKSMVAVAELSSQRANRMNRGHMLGIASKHLQIQGGTVLANKIDDEGKPIVSWRVRLLPYLEPDGERMPKVFQSKFAPTPEHTTWKLVGTDLRPGNSWHVLFLETGPGTEVPWNKPDEFRFDPENPDASLGEEPPGGYAAVFQDGHVAMLTRKQLIEQLIKQFPADKTDGQP